MTLPPLTATELTRLRRNAPLAKQITAAMLQAAIADREGKRAEANARYAEMQELLKQGETK